MLRSTADEAVQVQHAPLSSVLARALCVTPMPVSMFLLWQTGSVRINLQCSSSPGKCWGLPRPPNPFYLHMQMLAYACCLAGFANNAAVGFTVQLQQTFAPLSALQAIIHFQPDYSKLAPRFDQLAQELLSQVGWGN